MLEPLRAVRGPTIRAMLKRTSIIAVALIAVLVGVRAAGQTISSDRYHEAAVTEVDRIEPALMLRVALTNAQSALQGYAATLEPRYRTAFEDAIRKFILGQLPSVLAANGGDAEVEASLTRLGRLSTAWLAVDAKVVTLAAIGRTVPAIRLARGALNPLIRQHQLLMGLLHRRRLAALREADRWASISYWLSNAAIGLGGVVIMLFAALVTRRVMKPLAALQEATARIARGLSGTPLPVRPKKDEIHDLAVAFNAMEQDLGLARRQLEARAAELEEANRLKSELVANVSHELRTPLSAIIGYSQLLLDADYAAIGQQERADLTTILTSAEHLLVIINDLLDVSRIETGPLEIVRQETDVRGLVRDACRAVEGQARAKGLTLVRELPDEPAPAFCDPVRVRQVLMNLLANAVKFTDRGTVIVRAESRGDWCELTVSDTGQGIPEDELPRIWQQFHQVDGSTTRRAGGTGLGLAIAQHLVALHGGTIGCQSELGLGSTFTVRLPAQSALHQQASERR